MLEKMTESLFAETLKRIAEDVWKTKFEKLVENVGLENQYRNTNALREMLTQAFMECLKRDAELKAKVEAAVLKASHEYFDKLK